MLIVTLKGMPIIFGYGSLIWRPQLKYEWSAPALLPGWRRRFSQKSIDHRGTPDFPGRVLNLHVDVGQVCQGLAYGIDSELWEETLEYLDEREQGGYDRVEVKVLVGAQTRKATTYIGRLGNPYEIKDESLAQTIAVIRQAEGPSGLNADYVSRLWQSMESWGISDPYVQAVFMALVQSGRD